MDEPGAVRMFLDHVTGLGHRSVALIDGLPEVDTVHRRVGAARRICAARGIQLTVRHAAPTEEGGWRAMTLLSRHRAAHRMRSRQPQPVVRGDYGTALLRRRRAVGDVGRELR
jgi:DNA-binding LacI/PurR family transcriptional regulator